MDSHYNTDDGAADEHTTSRKPLLLQPVPHGDTVIKNVTEGLIQPETKSVSVRDMVKRYNSAANNTTYEAPAHNAQISSSKSAFFGVSKFASQGNVNQFMQQMQQKEDLPLCNKCNNYMKCENCKRGSLPLNMKFSETPQDDYNNKVYLVDGGDMTSSSASSVDGSSGINPICKNSLEALNTRAVEATYQSKTTIAKTTNGVRIIIDIFFENDDKIKAAGEMVGSRIDTQLPKSRILSELYEQHVASKRAKM